MLPRSAAVSRTPKPTSSSSIFGRVKKFGWGSWKQFNCADDQTLDLESVSFDQQDDITTATSGGAAGTCPQPKLSPKFHDKIEVVLTGSLSKEEEEVTFSSDRVQEVVDGQLQQPTSSTTYSTSKSSISPSPHDDQALQASSPPCGANTLLSHGTAPTISDPLEYILNNLLEQDLETAAMASHQYCQLRQQLASDDNPIATASTVDSSVQRYYAQDLVQRHLTAEKGDAEKALSKVQSTLAFRRNWKVHETRQTFHDDNPHAIKRQRRIATYLGRSSSSSNSGKHNHQQASGGKLFVRGYDRQGHACIHFILRNGGNHNNNHSNQDSLGCMLAFLYVLEKAIACSEAHPNNTDGMVTVSVDLKGFQPKHHVPPMDALQQLVLLLKNHYPERLFRVTFVDAPILFRYVWAVLLKPRITDPVTRDKFHFCTGRFQRNRLVRAGGGGSAVAACTSPSSASTSGGLWDLDQCMPYQHPQGKLVEDVDMEAFYKLPLDQAYLS